VKVTSDPPTAAKNRLAGKDALSFDVTVEVDRTQPVYWSRSLRIAKSLGWNRLAEIGE